MACIEDEEERGRSRMELQPGLRDVLKGLKSNGIRIAIATRNSFKTIEVFLALSGFQQDFFDNIITRDFEYRKPQAEVARYLCRDTFKLHPSQVLFVGDSRDDLECANASGCISALLVNEDNKTLTAQAQYSFKTIADTLNFVKNTRH